MNDFKMFDSHEYFIYLLYYYNSQLSHILHICEYKCLYMRVFKCINTFLIAGVYEQATKMKKTLLGSIRI